MPKFNYVFCFIQESKDLDELSIDMLQGFLLVHEQKIIHEDKEEQALNASTNNNPWTANRSGDWVEVEEEESMEPKIEVKEEVDEAILGLMKTNQSSKTEVKDEINNLINQRWSALNAINSAIIILKVILNYLMRKKKGREI